MNERLMLIEEIHSPVRKNFLRRRVLCLHIDNQWEADLVEMIPYSSQNKGMKYILTVIDTFSKYAWVVPLKSKACACVTEAFKSILDTGRKPKHLHTDKGI